MVGGEWGPSEAGGQNRSNDDLMMGGRNFALEAYLEMIHFSLSPPWSSRLAWVVLDKTMSHFILSVLYGTRADCIHQIYIRWFWTKRCHTDRRTAVFGPLGAKQGALAIKLTATDVFTFFLTFYGSFLQFLDIFARSGRNTDIKKHTALS